MSTQSSLAVHFKLRPLKRRSGRRNFGHGKDPESRFPANPCREPGTLLRVQISVPGGVNPSMSDEGPRREFRPQRAGLVANRCGGLQDCAHSSFWQWGRCVPCGQLELTTAMIPEKMDRI